MKIVRSGLGLRYVEWEDAAGLDGNDIVLVLQDTFDQNKFFVDQQQSVFLKHVGSNDDIGDAGLIFHAEENETLGRARALANDDTSSHAHRPAIAQIS